DQRAAGRGEPATERQTREHAIALRAVGEIQLLLRGMFVARGIEPSEMGRNFAGPRHEIAKLHDVARRDDARDRRVDRGRKLRRSGRALVEIEREKLRRIARGAELELLEIEANRV